MDYTTTDELVQRVLAALMSNKLTNDENWWKLVATTVERIDYLRINEPYVGELVFVITQHENRAHTEELVANPVIYNKLKDLFYRALDTTPMRFPLVRFAYLIVNKTLSP